MAGRCLTFVLVFALLSVSAIAQASWPGENGQIVYIVPKDGRWVIKAMDSDGSHREELSISRKSETGHSLSPDGKRIVFSRAVSKEQSDLFVMDIDGTDVTRLTWSKLGDVHASWSPDGKSLIYSRYVPGYEAWDLFTMDVANGNMQRVASVEGTELYPRWSPDGDVIAYTAEYGQSLQLMSADGSNRRTLASWSRGPADWHPDGDRLVVDGYEPSRGQQGIFIIHKAVAVYEPVSGLAVETVPVATLVVEGVGWSEPVFSPDGERIAAVRWDVPGEDLVPGVYVMNLDGTDMARIHRFPCTDLDWQAT